MAIRLDRIRKTDKLITKRQVIIHSVCFLILGILLGVFAKWLDNLSIDDTVWWQHAISAMNLNNFFSGFSIWLLIALMIAVYSNAPFTAAVNVLAFFIGMTVSYHVYTIVFAGFNPWEYMLIWYGITRISPLMAFVCWYAKGRSFVSMLLSGVIIAVMRRVCFSYGIWYFDINSILDTFVFIMALVVLHTTLAKSIGSMILAVLLAIGISLLI